MIERTIIYYFTGTGNTKLVAESARDRIRALGAQADAVEILPGIQAERKAHIAGIVFPVYGLNLPAAVKRFLKSMPALDGREAFIIANSHSSPGMTKETAAKILKRKGYSVIGTADVFTPSSSVITEETESEDIAAGMRARAAESAAAFAGKIYSGENIFSSGNLTGKQKALSVFFNAAMPGAAVKKFNTTENCESCGVCARICPHQNISLIKGRPSWGKDCSVCLRCLNLCPSSAIELMASPGRARYREPSFRP